MDADLVERFLRAMDVRLSGGEIGPVMRSSLEKSVRAMLEFQLSGEVRWRRRPARSGVTPFYETVLEDFAASSRQDLSVGSTRLAVGEARQFLRFLDRSGKPLGDLAVDDVRGYLIDVRPRHTSGMGNPVWAIRRFLRFTNSQGLTGVDAEGLLGKVGPRRVRVLPCFTMDETTRILAAIDTSAPHGKRDYAMVALALSTGLRGVDIVELRRDAIDWHRDEIRLVQRKTSEALTLPLSAPAGNAIADWLLNGRPESTAPEVFVRLKAPFVRLTGPTGALLMARWLDKAGVIHRAGDGKTFHALRRTTGTRLVESGAQLELTAQILGHSRIDSSRRYIALADASLRECCLPLDSWACTREGLR
ncbi:hypothetical protein GCM10023171_28390 [Microbacterium panaciterrae]|uniref:Tyr recombinase domain-containing protein n=2 Tax=Microbacterium panaciterrae TaxID=985759 RepID=A0ABP8PM79_9MICO